MRPGNIDLGQFLDMIIRLAQVVGVANVQQGVVSPCVNLETSSKRSSSILSNYTSGIQKDVYLEKLMALAWFASAECVCLCAWVRERERDRER